MTSTSADSDEFYVLRMGREEGPHRGYELKQLIKRGELTSSNMVRHVSGGRPFRVSEIPGLFSRKQWMTVLILSIFLGGLGIDRFYLGHTGLGVIKLLTCGGLGLWSLVDVILVALDKLEDSEGLPLSH
jgi:hypothetical protein